jgi:hypothetical protein
VAEDDGKSGAEGANISQGEQAEIGERLLTESSQGNEGSSFDLLRTPNETRRRHPKASRLLAVAEIVDLGRIC